VLGRVLPVGYGTASEGTRWRRIGSEGRHPATSCRWQQKILRRERPVYPKTGQSHPKKQLRYVWPLLPLRGHHHHEIQ